MFDILMFLFESYIDAGNYPDSDKLSLKLTAAGFEDDDIHLALSWLSGLKQLNPENYPHTIKQNSMRFFAEEECKLISLDSRRFLLFWEQSQIITPIEREMIIDRAMAIGRDDLALDKIKLIVLMVLWSRNEKLDPMLIEELLAPAGQSLLH